MAGSISFTYDNSGDGISSRAVRKVIAAWTSDASGDAAGTCVKIVGSLVKATTVPGAGGTAPSDNYDITLTDDKSINVLATCAVALLDRDTANTEEQYFFVLNSDSPPLSVSARPAVCSPLTFTVANAGNVKSGTIHLYYKGA